MLAQQMAIDIANARQSFGLRTENADQAHEKLVEDFQFLN